MKDGIGTGRTIGKLPRNGGGKERKRERSHAIDGSL